MDRATPHTYPTVKSRARHGFTLVELSVVLVILGLLVGGIIVGKSLMRKAALRGVITEFQQYRSAVAHFQEQYNALPGDMATATRIWGDQSGSPIADGDSAACAALTTPATGVATCNGDGSGAVTENFPPEVWRVWHHLVNAGMIEGKFSGIAGPAGPYNAVIGTNVPRSRLTGAGWELIYLGELGSANFFNQKYGHILSFGSNNAGENDWVNNPELSSVEAFGIDTKLDDGKPHNGKILTWRNIAAYPDCIVGAEDDYTLTTRPNTCALLFITGY